MTVFDGNPVSDSRQNCRLVSKRTSANPSAQLPEPRQTDRRVRGWMYVLGILGVGYIAVLAASADPAHLSSAVTQIRESPARRTAHADTPISIIISR